VARRGIPSPECKTRICPFRATRRRSKRARYANGFFGKNVSSVAATATSNGTRVPLKRWRRPRVIPTYVPGGETRHVPVTLLWTFPFTVNRPGSLFPVHRRSSGKRRIFIVVRGKPNESDFDDESRRRLTDVHARTTYSSWTDERDR